MPFLKNIADLLNVDTEGLLVGLVIGIGVVLLLRAGQLWRYRRTYGYDVYTADLLRRRLIRWAVVALLAGVVIGGLYLWQASRPHRPSLPAATTLSEATAEPVPELRLQIPRLAVDAPLVEAPIVGHQWDISRLRGEIAHLEGTAYPGESGNAVLAGHVTIPGAGWGPFRELDTLQPGDQIFIERGRETLIYTVTDLMTVDSTAVEVVYPTEEDQLTLITCSGWDDSTETYAERVVVIARPAPTDR